MDDPLNWLRNVWNNFHTTKLNAALTMLAINTFGGVVIPQLLLPAYFSGVTNQDPSWQTLVWYTYIGVFASIIGSLLFTLLFRRSRNFSELLLRLVQATILCLVWLNVVTAIACFGAPFTSTWSLSQVISAFFQYPAYAAVSVWNPGLVWLSSVIIYDVWYFILVR
jgi:hypothetical protein